MRASARSFMSFVLFCSVLIKALALEMLRPCLVLFSLCSRAKTPPGYLSFFFHSFAGMQALMSSSNQALMTMHSQIHLIKDFK